MPELPRAALLSADEYDALPEDNRIELVDGAVQIRPTGTHRHQIVVDHLRAALEFHCPDNLRIARGQEIRIADLHRRDPDLMAVRAEVADLDSCRCAPKDVVLGVEVVSPHTQVIDRLHKPAGYAAAGIQHYWRVEIIPQVAVHTHPLADTGSYVKSGLFIEGDSISAPGLPWAKIAVTDLAPRPVAKRKNQPKR